MNINKNKDREDIISFDDFPYAWGPPYIEISSPIEAANKGRKVPSNITDFGIKRVRIGGCDFYEVESDNKSGWEKIDPSWIKGGPASCYDRAGTEIQNRLDRKAWKLEAEGKEMLVVCLPISNAFNVFVRPKNAIRKELNGY